MTLFATGPTLPLRRLLIANRGEIAVRIIRACRDEGIETVAVYADADRDAPFVGMADQAFALGGDKPAETYLDGAKIIAIARRAGADAIHPGYGFLSENAGFAQAVQDAGLIWIGPDPAVITALGDKIEARHARAKGMSELQGQSVEGRMLEVEQAAQNTQAQARLAQLKAELGLGAATTTGPDLAKGTEPAAQPAPEAQPGA